MNMMKLVLLFKRYFHRPFGDVDEESSESIVFESSSKQGSVSQQLSVDEPQSNEKTEEDSVKVIQFLYIQVSHQLAVV